MYQNFTANATGTVARVYGGEVHVHLSGSFGSGTFVLQMQLSNGEWSAISGASWTSAVDTLVDLANNNASSVRLVLTGSTTPDVDAELRE